MITRILNFFLLTLYCSCIQCFLFRNSVVYSLNKSSRQCCNWANFTNLLIFWLATVFKIFLMMNLTGNHGETRSIKFQNSYSLLQKKKAIHTSQGEYRFSVISLGTSGNAFYSRVRVNIRHSGQLSRRMDQTFETRIFLEYFLCGSVLALETILGPAW